MNHKPRVLFFSTGDSTRSQIAEGFLRSFAGDRLIAVSSATQSVEADPLARDVMNEVGIDISGQHPKAVAESFKEHFSCVVSICDSSKERFPVWPFVGNIRRWSLVDPKKITGSTEQKRELFRRLRDDIRNHVTEFLDQAQARPEAAKRT
jgi:arsenate reductase (thioredoxin)